MFVVKLAARGVTGAYGLTKEAMADLDAKKPGTTTQSQQPSQSRLQVPSRTMDDAGDLSDTSSVNSSDGEDEAQDLDEAQQAYAGDKEKMDWDLQQAKDVDAVFDNFMRKHPPPKYTPVAGRLELPVILPQRRPKNKERGFVRAYSPVLETCGVSQTEFLDFLDGFGKAIQV